MRQYTTREAAKRLGLSLMSIQRYIAAKKIPVPPLQRLGGAQFRIWTDEDIEHVRKLLPKIANGRKTRYQRNKQLAVSNQQSGKITTKTKKRKGN